MKRRKQHSQRDIWWVDLPKYEESQGSELHERHACVILQRNTLNRKLDTTIVAPLLRGHKPHDNVVNVNPTDDNNLDEPRHIQLIQMRCISVTRLDNPSGVLEEEVFWELEKAFLATFGELFSEI